MSTEDRLGERLDLVGFRSWAQSVIDHWSTEPNGPAMKLAEKGLPILNALEAADTRIRELEEELTTQWNKQHAITVTWIDACKERDKALRAAREALGRIAELAEHDRGPMDARIRLAAVYHEVTAALNNEEVTPADAERAVDD